MSLSITSSTYATSEAISESIDIATTKGAAPFSQIDMDSLYPKVEKPSSSTSLSTDVRTWNGSIDDTYYWDANPTGDKTPSNLKDNSAWCNSLIWDYGKVDLHSPVRTNPGTSYTDEFRNFVNIYPFAEVPGNEYLYCQYSRFGQINGTPSPDFAEAKSDVSLFYMIEAKMNVNVSIKGKEYNLQISALPDPNKHNSFVMNGEFYYINNFFMSNGGDINDFEENKIYMVEGLPKKLGIKINDTLNISSKTKTKKDTYKIDVAGFGWNPEYIFLDDMFFNANDKTITLDRSPGDENLLVGFVTAETFTNIARKIYTDSEISRNDLTISSEGEITKDVNKSIFDYTLNISDINLIDSIEKGIYDNSSAFDSSYNKNSDTSHKYNSKYSDYVIGHTGGPYYYPAYKKVNKITEDFLDYFSFSISDDISKTSLIPSNYRAAYVPEYVELSRVKQQVNFFETLSQTVLITLLIITILVSIFIVYKICSYFRKKIGVLKSQGFDVPSIVFGINFSIVLTVIISILVSIALFPAFSIIWSNLANQSLTTTIPIFGLNLSNFYTLMFLPLVLVLIFSFLFTYILTRPNSLSLMKDVKTSKPSLVGRMLDKTNLSNYSFMNSYFIKNLSNNLFKSFSMILIVSSFSIFLLLSVSAGDLTGSTVESISSQMDINFASVNNTKFQKTSYMYDDVFEEDGSPKSDFQVIELNIDTSRQINLLTPSEYISYISQVKSILEMTNYNGHQLFLVDELSYIDNMIRYANDMISNATPIDPWADPNIPDLSMYNNKLSTLGIHETNNKYLSLGFDVTDESQIDFRVISSVNSTENKDAFEPYIEDKIDTSKVTPNPDENVINPDKVPGSGPKPGSPSINYENLFNLSLVSYSYSMYKLNIDYSNAKANGIELDHVNLDGVLYDSSNKSWEDDKVNEEVTVVFDNLNPETTYFYNFTFRDSKNVMYESSSYQFTTSIKEFATGTGNHYTPGTKATSTFSATTKYCTYLGEVDIEPTDGSFYLPFDSLTENCVYDLQIDPENKLGPVMLIESNDITSYVELQEVNPDFNYQDYLNEVNKSDGKVPILAPSVDGKLIAGDNFKGMDFSKHGKDIFAPDASSYAIDSQFYVYDTINLPFSYLGSIVPINDPDFSNNQFLNETTGLLETTGNIPVNANNGNMLTRAFTSKSNGGLLSKSDEIGDSFKTLSVGIRVNEYDSASSSYNNSNLFSDTLSFNLFELINGNTISKDYRFDVNNSDKILSNDAYQLLDKIIYAISKIDNISFNNIGSIILAVNSLDFNNLTIPGNDKGPTSQLVNTPRNPTDPSKNKFTSNGAIFQNEIIDWYNDYMYYAMKEIEPNVYKLDYVTEEDKLGDNLPYNLVNLPDRHNSTTTIGKIESVVINIVESRMVNNVDFVNEFYKSVYGYQSETYTYTPPTGGLPGVGSPNIILGIFNAESMAGRSDAKLLLGKILSINFLSNIQEFNGDYNDLISTSFSKTDNIGLSIEALIYRITEPSLASKQKLINSLLILGLVLSAALMLIMLSMYTNSSKKEINILKSIGWGSKSVFISNSYNVVVYALSILIAFLISGYALTLISSGLGYVLSSFPIAIFLSSAAIIALSLIILALLIMTFAYNIYKYNTSKIDRESIL